MYNVSLIFELTWLVSPLLSRHDQSLTTPVRDVTHTDSRSVFHVPTSPTQFGGLDEEFEVIVSTKQFGVPLERLKERNGGDPIPFVLRCCVEFVEQTGMEVEGVFRRAPNTVTMHQIKKKFDLGKDRAYYVSRLGTNTVMVVKLAGRRRPLPDMDRSGRGRHACRWLYVYICVYGLRS